MASTTYVSLDLELIEANSPGSRVIEIGAVRFDQSGIHDEWSSLVNPESSIPYAIRQLTGLDDASVTGAPTLAQLASRIRSFVGHDPLVGQSIELDVGHLERQGVPLSNPLLDTFELATLVLPGLRTYDLPSIAHELGLDGGRERARHRALADAHLAREVFLALLDRVWALPLDVLIHVNRVTAGIAWPYSQLFREAEQECRHRLVEGALTGGRVGDVALGLPGSLSEPQPDGQSLVPHVRRRRLNVDELVAALSTSGSVARRLQRYEERPEQLAMLRAVADSFNREHHLVVEAGTGTGKSLAYLLPALAFAESNDRRVVISTNTINLQDQLFEKDVPDLVAAMGYSVRSAVLKGRSNYLCLQRWRSLLRGDSFREEEATLLTKTALWISQTASGDRSELRLTPEEESAWLRVCSQAESCSPRTCPYHRDGTCFVVRARRTAEASHIVIVNHALLLSDVMASSRVIPDYDHLIVDEAHHLEEEATAQLSSSVGLRTYMQPLDALVGPPGRQQFGSLHLALALLRGADVAEKRLAQLMEQVEVADRGAIEAVRHVGDMFEAVRELLTAGAARGELVPTVRLTPSARRESAWLVVEQSWAAARGALHTILRGIGPLIDDVEDAATAGHQGAAELLAELLGAVHELEAAMEPTQAIVEKPSRDSVCWAGELNGVVTLHLAPLDVAPPMRRWLLDPKTTVVFTSATLSTEGSFEYVRDRLGVEDAEELALGSPFDYRRAALLFVPTDLPEPTQPGYARPAAEAIADVAEAMGGRTLALFTSHAQLRTTRDLIRDRMERAEIVLMSQGIDGSRTRLLQRFKDTERALLLGTASFWEGVDVVGGALSALLIARLPFAVPTEPVFAARAEQFEDPFHQYAVPHAILRLKQGFGRLIRSKTDRGIVVILDRRIVTKTYGPAFLNSLPPCTLRVAPVATAGPAASDWVTMPITLDASTTTSTTLTVPGS